MHLEISDVDKDRLTHVDLVTLESVIKMMLWTKQVTWVARLEFGYKTMIRFRDAWALVDLDEWLGECGIRPPQGLPMVETYQVDGAVG